MKKKILLLITITMICFFNFFLFLSQPSSEAKQIILPGILGSYGGVPICHCPDDARSCGCHMGH